MIRIIIHFGRVDSSFNDSAQINVGLMICFTMRMAPAAFKTTTDSLLFLDIIVIPWSLGPGYDYPRKGACLYKIVDRYYTGYIVRFVFMKVR